jgi:hypothetical protein
MEGEIGDSPFDQLDRVSDFYSAYILKLLRLRGDARVQDVQLLANYLAGKDDEDKPIDRHFRDAVFDGEHVTPPDIEANHRLIVLYFQAHVHPGTLPNHMTGLRITLDDTVKDQIKILRLHPTRNYDVDNTLFAENLAQTLALTGKVTAPLKFADIDASGSRQASLEAEARRKFLSRVGKSASYADASSGMFGWNFYPSNLEVVRPNAPERIGGWLFGTPRAYKTRAFLEGGARDARSPCWSRRP